MVIRAGELRQRITIHKAGETGSTSGAVLKSFGELEEGAKRWAAIEPLSGNEQLVGNQTEARVSHRIRMRKPEDITITSEMRCVEGERVFHISSVVDVGERRRELELLCTEVV